MLKRGSTCAYNHATTSVLLLYASKPPLSFYFHAFISTLCFHELHPNLAGGEVFKRFKVEENADILFSLTFSVQV